MAAAATSEQPPKKPLKLYAAELRQWLHWTKQCQFANFSYQAMLLNQALNPPTPRVYLHDGNHNIIHASTSPPEQPVNIPGQQMGINYNNGLPRVFPMSAGKFLMQPFSLIQLVYLH